MPLYIGPNQLGSILDPIQSVLRHKDTSSILYLKIRLKNTENMSPSVTS